MFCSPARVPILPLLFVGHIFLIPLFVANSCLTLCDPHGLQHARLHCPPLSPGFCSNPCPLSLWCRTTILSSVIPFFSCLQSFPAPVFSHESVLCIRWPKYWSFNFSISPSNEYSGLISFRIDSFDRLTVQGTLQHHRSKASILQHFSTLVLQYQRS